MADKTFQEIGEGLVPKKGWTPETFDRLHKMIDYAIKRQDWYEDQRNKVLSLAIGLLGLSSFLVAGLLAPNVTEMYWFRMFGCFTVVSIVWTAFLVISEYAAGARESYTHRRLADIRSWYSAYVINDAVIDAAKFNSEMHTQNKTILLDAWKKFVKGWLEFHKESSRRGVEDLQQVFILYLFQAMRRNSLRKMIEYAVRGGQVIATFLVLTIICAAARI